MDDESGREAASRRMTESEQKQANHQRVLWGSRLVLGEEQPLQCRRTRAQQIVSGAVTVDRREMRSQRTRVEAHAAVVISVVAVERGSKTDGSSSWKRPVGVRAKDCTRPASGERVGPKSKRAARPAAKHARGPESCCEGDEQTCREVDGQLVADWRCGDDDGESERCGGSRWE